MRIVVSFVVFVAASAQAAATPPRIFFSDLESGPKTGGQDNAGAFITLYGTRFGATRGTSYVTVGQVRAASYTAWTDTRITVQPGAQAETGDIIVTTPGGVSNGIAFTVRSGSIYFISVRGSDGNDGSYAKPWRTLLKARDSIRAGDIAYAMDGVSQITDDGQGWAAAMLLRSGGSPGAPKALVAYPGAVVTIGSASGPSYGIRTVDTGANPGFWVLAGLTLRGGTGALILGGPSSNWRIVGNDLSCPNGDGQVGCLGTGLATYVKILGNTIHHAGSANASAHYHGLYLSTDSNHAEVGWNTVAYVRGCRGIQVHSSPLGPGGARDPTGRNMFDLSVHDNLIHDTQCDGLLLATVDPSQGKVEVYNNIVYNAGQGPNNPENTGAWTCVNVPGTTANGSPGGGMVEVFNNTLFNCGSHPNPPYPNASNAIENGGNNTNLKIRIRNNIIVQPRGVPYLTIFGPENGIQGTSNLFYGNDAAPLTATLTKSTYDDPQFVNAAQYDFRLGAGSPARSAGVDTNVTTDKNGRSRGGAAGNDLGALQFAGPEVTSMICSPVVIRASGTAVCSTDIDVAAPPRGLELTAASDSTALAVPPRIAVSPGATRGTFEVTATTVTASVAASVTVAISDSSWTALVWLLSEGDRSPALAAVFNAASLTAGAVAPGEIISAFGWNLGSGVPLIASPLDGEFPMSAAGVTAFFDEIPAPLLYVERNQLNAVVPLALGRQNDVRMEIDVGGRRSNPLVLRVSPVSPAVFTAGSGGNGGAVVVNQDGSPNTPANPARRGSSIMLYATGLGEMDPPAVDGMIAGLAPQPITAPADARVGGAEGPLLFAGAAPGFVTGLYQVNLRIPAGAPAGAAVPLVLTVAGVNSQPAVTLAVE